PRLGAHLRVVHDVAWSLTDALGRRWPDLDFDTPAVLFGAATHDIGKVLHVEELSGPGSAHEAAGERLRLGYGVRGPRAPLGGTRCARRAPRRGPAAARTAPGPPLEDLLVSRADKIWKGSRVPELEQRVIAATGRT